MKDIADFYTRSASLLQCFNKFAEKHELFGVAVADHMCYKCGSREEFERIRTLFEKESAYIYQSIISGRPIAVIKMKREIESVLGAISYLELSNQKPDGSQKSGFDHIEIYPVGISYEVLVKKIEEKGTATKKVVRSHHTTVDIEIGDGYLVRLESEPLIDKIKREEMR